MSELYFNLKHDGGSHLTEIEIFGEQTVIRFGSSFTLRVDEKNLEKLVDHLQGTLDEVRELRRSGRLAAAPCEDDMIQQGIEAREKLKELRRSGRSEQRLRRSTCGSLREQTTPRS